MAWRRGRNQRWPLGFWFELSVDDGPSPEMETFMEQPSCSSGPAVFLEPCSVQVVIALGAAQWTWLGASLTQFAPGRKTDMKQNYQKEKKLVISDDLITILVSTRMEKKMHDDQSACGRGLWPVYKISSRKWLLRKILKDKFKKWLARDWVFWEARCVLETAFLKVLRQKRSMARSTKCGWESPAYWTSGSKGKLCKRRGFLCSSVGKEFACRWNMYITIREIDHQSKFNEWNRALKVGVLGWPGGMGWETHVHPWLMHVNLWQKPPQYCEAISLQLNWFF